MDSGCNPQQALGHVMKLPSIDVITGSCHTLVRVVSPEGANQEIGGLVIYHSVCPVSILLSRRSFLKTKPIH